MSMYIVRQSNFSVESSEVLCLVDPFDIYNQKNQKGSSSSDSFYSSFADLIVLVNKLGHI